MALIKCPECGNMISEQAVSCPGCGMPLHKESREFKNSSDAMDNRDVKQVSEKSRLVTLVLSVLLGFLGVHKFYVGKSSGGICSVLLLLATFIVNIIALFVWPIAFLFPVIVAIIIIRWIIDICLVVCGVFTDGDGLVIKNW